MTLTRVRYYFYYRASGKVLCRCLPSGTRGEVDSPTFDRNNAEPGAQPDCPKAAVRSAFGVPSARAALRQLVRSNYKGFPISCKCFSVSCSVFRLVHVLPACVVREDGGLRNYNRSCWASCPDPDERRAPGPQSLAPQPARARTMARRNCSDVAVSWECASPMAGSTLVPCARALAWSGTSMTLVRFVCGEGRDGHPV